MTSTTPTDDGLSRQFELLANPCRRRALVVLATGELPMTLRDLAIEVVTREHDADLPDVPGEALTDVYLSLLHVHVPALVAAGVLAYDPERTLVEGAALEGLEPALSVAVDAEPRRRRIA